MKIFSQKQIYEADKATLAKENIPSINLMERAGGYAFNWIDQRLQGGAVPIKVFCGIGNNGGDGLVIARNLIEKGYSVQTYIVNYSDHRSKDFLLAYDRLKQQTKNWPEVIKIGQDIPEIGSTDLVIDALFGIGYNRPVDKWVHALYERINNSGAYVLSIDIPSGLYMDKVPGEDEVYIQPTTVLTFQFPKLIFFLPQTGKYIDNWTVIDIGLDAEYMATTPTDIELIDKFEAQQMYRPKTKFSHKGTNGHSLIIGGSYGKMGSVTMSAKACLHSGSGLVTAFVPALGVDIMQTAFPEAMVVADRHRGKYLEEIDFELDPDVIGIGMGMGTEGQTIKAFGDFLKSNKKPLVVDADALNILAKNPDFLQYLPNKSILTPHPKELERLIGEWEDDFDKLEKAKQFAKEHDIVLVIKGAHTITVYDNKLYINNTGNPGMGTAGAGDVLTGVITGLLAQQYDPLHAAIFGVYLHGRAGDIAISHTSYESLIAGNLVEFLGQAFVDLFKKPEQPQMVQ